MDKLVGLIKKAPKSRDYNDDDVIDRLSSRYTVVLLICFSLLVSMNQYVRNPITCMIPQHFRGDQSKFATSYCWVKDTYYLTWNTMLEPAGHNKNKQMIAYYQWIPFILVAQAVLFYLPSVVWHSLNSRSGVDADNILEAAHTFSMTDKVETRDRTMKMLVQQIHRFLKSHLVEHGGKKRRYCACCGKGKTRQCVGTRIGNYLVIIFILSKVFYLLNIFGQLFFLSKLLSTDFYYFGVDLLSEMMQGSDWTNDDHVVFPRETICEFDVLGLDPSNRHNYTVQCVLPVNMYNEKIYLFLWCWMMFLACVTSGSLIMWLLRSFCSKDRERFVKNHVLDATGFRQEQKVSEQEQQPQSRQTYDSVVVQQKSGKLSTEKVPNNQNNPYMQIQTESNKGTDYTITMPSEKKDEFDGNVRKFCRKYLMQDGELLLRLIAHNTDHVTTTEVIYEVWRNWLELENGRKKSASTTSDKKEGKKKNDTTDKSNNFDFVDGSKTKKSFFRTKKGVVNV